MDPKSRPVLHLVAPAALASASAAPSLPPSDDELMQATAAGDRAAFDRLVRRHQRRVIGYAMKFFGSSALAADLAQDVFVDLLRAASRYRAEGHFPTYLYRITLNRCRMAARTHRYEESRRATLKREARATDPGPDPERDRAVQAAMLRLTEKQREVLLLRFWSGLKHEEIAAAVGARVGTVKSRLFGALAALRKELAREAP
jgi:RNA polymerase sigma-70 factor (ECF subfamily)